MKSEFIKVPFFLLLLLMLVFGAHLLLNHFVFHCTFTPYMLEAYTLNYLLALGEFMIIKILVRKITDHLGYLFIGSSAVKFIVAFSIFHPLYKIDGKISKAEFATIFIPFAAALIGITIQLLKMLKKTDENRK